MSDHSPEAAVTVASSVFVTKNAIKAHCVIASSKDESKKKENTERTNDACGSTASVKLSYSKIKDLDEETPKTFPQVLMEILSNEDHADILSWLPHGKSFIIYKKKSFALAVLPLYFKGTLFTSFTRKLNRWGFTRITRGPEMGSYFHMSFLRDSPELCLEMSSNNSTKKKTSSETNQTATFGPLRHDFAHNPTAGIGPKMTGAHQSLGALSKLSGPSDFSQQNQYINQQLQQLQWQQYQNKQVSNLNSSIEYRYLELSLSLAQQTIRDCPKRMYLSLSLFHTRTRAHTLFLHT